MENQVVEVKPKINWMSVLVVVLMVTNLITLVFVVVMVDRLWGMGRLKIGEESKTTELTPTPVVSIPIVKPTSSPSLTPIDLMSKYWYEMVALKNKPDAVVMGKLDVVGNFVDEFGQPTIIKHRVGFNPYDDNTNLYNKSFFFKFDKPLGKTVSQDFPIEVRVGPVTNEMGKYLDNSKYCAMDSDCEVRYELCEYGAFNEFVEYRPNSGCGMASYPEEKVVNVSGEGTIDNCPIYQVNLKYSGAKCVNNGCVATGRQFKCDTTKQPAP